MTPVDISQFDKQRFYLLKHKVKNDKARLTDHVLEQDPYGEYEKGSRYNNDERIAKMVVGMIYTQTGYDIEAAKSKFLALNSVEIEPYIKKAVLDSAYADYYYNNEKSWD